MTEAVTQLRKGLDLLSGVGDGAARQQQELDLQITLGHALMGAKGLGAPEPGEVFVRARQLCEQLDRPQQLGTVLTGQWIFRLVRAELGQLEHHAAEVRNLGEARNDEMWKCFGSSFSGMTCAWLGSSSMPATTSKTLFPYGTRCFGPSWPRQMIYTLRF